MLVRSVSFQYKSGVQLLLESISEVRSWWGGHRFVCDLVAKWPHLFVIKFVYWWWNVCILCITCS